MTYAKYVELFSKSIVAKKEMTAKDFAVTYFTLSSNDFDNTESLQKS
jgi:hypothetical protein